MYSTRASARMCVESVCVFPGEAKTICCTIMTKTALSQAGLNTHHNMQYAAATITLRGLCKTWRSVL